ncbi:ArsR family transcriptional regulator [Streptomyces sp. NBRC 110028]|uniref:ArsR family transcriptional regulator n=1 Tax=Streptomyces sp. NBRC 110028 TaxID=1621260 RepID=UPI0006E388FF|nr:ArsR family transcriptional regulator [Streptomyces sp. NBRC 110028]
MLGLDEDSAVVIRQLACTESGTPPLETAIAVFPLEGRVHRWTLHSVTELATEVGMAQSAVSHHLRLL